MQPVSSSPGLCLINRTFAELKDQIAHTPDNTDRFVAKQKFKIPHCRIYNKALINRGSLIFWLDDEAIQAWYQSATPTSRRRPQRYSEDLAISTLLAIKRVFRRFHRKIRSAAADSAYDTRLCHDEVWRKKISALLRPEKEQVTGPVNMQTVTVQLLTSV